MATLGSSCRGSVGRRVSWEGQAPLKQARPNFAQAQSGNAGRLHTEQDINIAIYNFCKQDLQNAAVLSNAKDFAVSARHFLLVLTRTTA